jgi:20S proteasome alpha/beta subunit
MSRPFSLSALRCNNTGGSTNTESPSCCLGAGDSDILGLLQKTFRSLFKITQVTVQDLVEDSLVVHALLMASYNSIDFGCQVLESVLGNHFRMYLWTITYRLEFDEV